MATAAWKEILGWNGEQLNELRSAGFDYLRQGHYSRATIYFEALVALDPQSFFDRFTLGALYLQMADYRRSLQCFNEALNLDPKNFAAKLNKAKVLLSMGLVSEGLNMARELQSSADEKIRNVADALVMGYG